MEHASDALPWRFSSLPGSSQSACMALNDISIQDGEINKLIKKQVVTPSKHLRLIKLGILCGTLREIVLTASVAGCI